MDINRFEDLIDLRGTDLDLWPAAEAEDARRLIAESDGARMLFEDAKGSERLLSGALRVEPAPLGLATRITTAAIDDVPRSHLPHWLTGMRLALGGGAMSIAASVLGFVVANALLGSADPGYSAILTYADGSVFEAMGAL